MNPNLRIFLKRTAIFLLGSGALIAAGYFFFTYTSISIKNVAAFLFKIFMGILMTGMTVLILGLLFKEIITGILRRAERIELLCADENEKGIHVITTHYHSGGDAGDGFSSYPHYYILLADGHIFLSRKITGTRDDQRSLEFLASRMKTPLSYRKDGAISIPGYDEDEKKHAEGQVEIGPYTVKARSYRNWFDYGFRITCRKDGKFCWKRLL